MRTHNAVDGSLYLSTYIYYTFMHMDIILSTVCGTQPCTRIYGSVSGAVRCVATWLLRGVLLLLAAKAQNSDNTSQPNVRTGAHVSVCVLYAIVRFACCMPAE